MRHKQTMLLLRHTVSLFGKRHAGGPRCRDDHLDKISSSPRSLSVSLYLCSFLTVSVGSATLSVSDVRAPLAHMWSERQGCYWCQPTQLSISNSGPYSRCCTAAACYQAGKILLCTFCCVFLVFSFSVLKGVTSLYLCGSQLNHAKLKKARFLFRVTTLKIRTYPIYEKSRDF